MMIIKVKTTLYITENYELMLGDRWILIFKKKQQQEINICEIQI